MRRFTLSSAALFAFACTLALPVLADDPWLVLEGKSGPGLGKHIVLISGDEEYRSEEALPQLAQMLSQNHGFKCTVLFAINGQGKVDPNQIDNIPGLEALKTADLAIMALRWRALPDDQMKYVYDYTESGKPWIGLRTATHAFKLKPGNKFMKYTYNFKDQGYDGGFGRAVLGETWVNHHGQHGSQSTLGIIVDKDHPVMKGIQAGDIYGPTDVYTVAIPLPGDSRPLVLGQVLTGMKPTDKPLEGPKNDPMMPVAWVKTFKADSGKICQVFTSTMGSSQDFESPGMRRMVVNATYWATGLADKISPDLNINFVGDFKPTPFGFGKFQKDKLPSEFLSK